MLLSLYIVSKNQNYEENTNFYFSFFNEFV